MRCPIFSLLLSSSLIGRATSFGVPVRAFCVVRPQTMNASPYLMNRAITTALYLTEETEEGLVDKTSEESDSKQSGTAPTKWKPPKVVLQIFEAVNLLFAYTMIFLGSLLSIGLLLNLCGYAYTVSWKDGIRVDTIQVLREEAQFQNEIRKSAKEATSRSTLPR